AAEGISRERPAEGVDDRVERDLGLPELLDAERIDLRVLLRDALPLEVRLREESARTLGERRHPRHEIGGWVVAPRRLAVATEPGWRRPDTDDPVPVHEQPRRREPGEDVDPQLLRPFPQPPYDLAD